MEWIPYYIKHDSFGSASQYEIMSKFANTKALVPNRIFSIGSEEREQVLFPTAILNLTVDLFLVPLIRRF